MSVKNEYYGFIYLTTNNVNGKQYIGQHKYNSNIKDDEYFGSGTRIILAIKKYGIKNFSKIVLENCKTKEELCEREKYWIEKYNAVNNDNFYNLIPGGYPGDTWTNRSYYKKKKFRDRIAESNRTRTLPEGYMMGDKNPAKGRKWYKDKIKRKTYYLFPDDPLIKELNLIPGMFRSKKHNKKISKALKGKHKQYISIPKGSICINNGIENKFIPKEELEQYLSDGYTKGMINNQRKKVRMNDGNKNRYIDSAKINHYLKKGFKLGWI